MERYFIVNGEAYIDGRFEKKTSKSTTDDQAARGVGNAWRRGNG